MNPADHYHITYTAYKIPSYQNREHKPEAFLIHHTAGALPNKTASLNILKNGRIGVPAPVVQWYIDRDGGIYQITEGYANHAGKGSSKVLDRMRAAQPPSTPGVDDTNGNPYFVGLEIENNGTGEPYTPAVKFATTALVAAYCAYNKWDPNVKVLGHKEWTTRKPDPSFDMPQFRKDVTTFRDALQKQTAPEPHQQTDNYKLVLMVTAAMKHTIREDDTGLHVQIAQNLINKITTKDTDLPATGVYTHDWVNRVKVFQLLSSVATDGVIGPVTWQKILNAQPPIA